MKNKQATNKTKAGILNALASKDREALTKALGFVKPFRSILFKSQNGKLFYCKSLTEGFYNKDLVREAVEEEITLQQKEEMVKALEKEYEVLVIKIVYPDSRC